MREIIDKLLILGKTKFIIGIFYLICFCVWFSQVFEISNNYFSYKTITSATYGNVTELSLPAMTICILKKYLIRDKYKNDFPFQENPQIDSSILQKFNNFSIKNQFERLLTTHEVFLNSCYVLKPKALRKPEIGVNEDIYTKCEDLSPIRHSIDYYFSCFTFLSQLKGESDDMFTVENDVLFRDFSVDLINITVMQMIPKIDVIIHSRKEKIMNRYKKPKITLFNTTLNYTYINYNKVIVHSLGKPYETNCVDYQRKDHYSRLNCIGKCRLENLVKNGKWPGAYLNDNTSDERAIAEIFFMFAMNKSLDATVGQLCKTECGTGSECFAEYYTMSSNPSEYYWTRFQFFIFSPFTPDLIYRHSPKLIFEEYFSFIGSLIGLWFGFSIVMLSNVMTIAVNYFKNVYKIKFNANLSQRITINNLQINTTGSKKDLWYLKPERSQQSLFTPRY